MGILLLAAALLLPLMMSGLDALVGKAGRLEVSEDQRTADLYAKNGEYVSEAFFRGRYQGEQFFSDHRLEDSLEHSIYLGDLQEAYITRNLLEVLSSGRSDYASMASGSLYCDYINNCYFRIRPEERAAIDYEGAANRTDPETEYLKERITNDTVTLMQEHNADQTLLRELRRDNRPVWHCHRQCRRQQRQACHEHISRQAGNLLLPRAHGGRRGTAGRLSGSLDRPVERLSVLRHPC